MAEREQAVDPSIRRLSRRRLLRGSLLGGAGLAAAALLGCTQDEDASPPPIAGGDADPTTTPSPAPAAEPGVARPGGDIARPTATPTPDGRDEEVQGIIINGHDLPYPYEFPEPLGLKPKAGGTLSIGATFDFGGLDPVHAAEGGSVAVLNMVYNRLIGMVGGIHKHPFGVDVEPEIASWWERTPDAALYSFGIRDDIKWQNIAPLNGRPFTSADVKYAFDRYSTGGLHQSYWANVGAIEAPSDTSMTIRMSKATADFILPLASRYQPIYPKELVDSGEIESRAVGSGPMILFELVEGSHAIFVKEPRHWEREALLDGARFEFVPDHAERLALFRDGRLDYAHLVATNVEALAALLDAEPNAQINLASIVAGSQPLGLNLAHPKFADERVRRAITLALDPTLMADRVYDAVAKVLPLHPWIYARDYEPDPGGFGPWFGRHDRDAAERLLQAAGAEDLSFDCVYHGYGDPTLHTITNMVVEQLAAVGITVHSRHLDRRDFEGIWQSGTLPEASTSARRPDGFDADHFFYQLVHSRSAKNLWGLDDPQVDAWAEAQQVELHPHARREIHNTMWEYFLDKMFWPPLPSPLRFEVYQPWLRGVRLGGILGTNTLHDLGEQIADAWIDDRVPGRLG